MGGRQLTIALYREESPPSMLRLEEPIRVYFAELTDAGAVRFDGLSVSALRDIAALCRAMVEAGMEDGALQVRAPGGEPVCFLVSIHQLAAGPTPERSSLQFELELAPC